MQLTSARTIAHQAVTTYKAQQNTDELAVLLAVLQSDLQPDAVLEIGCADGGTTWALSRVSTVKTLVTVDIVGAPSVADQVGDVCSYYHVRGPSTDPATVAAVTRALGDYSTLFVLVDASHDQQSCLDDTRTYLPMTRYSGMVGWHDTQGWHRQPGFGVAEVVTLYRATLDITDVIAEPGWQCGLALGRHRAQP